MSETATPLPSKSSATLIVAEGAAQPVAVSSKPGHPPRPARCARLLDGLRTDIAKSGFVMTLLAVAALVMSAMSLKVAIDQNGSAAIVITIPNAVDRPGRLENVRPLGRIPELLDPAETDNRFDEQRCAWTQRVGRPIAVIKSLPSPDAPVSFFTDQLD